MYARTMYGVRGGSAAVAGCGRRAAAGGIPFGLDRHCVDCQRERPDRSSAEHVALPMVLGAAIDAAGNDACTKHRLRLNWQAVVSDNSLSPRETNQSK